MVAAFATDPASVSTYYADNSGVVGGGQRSVGRTEVDAYWKTLVGSGMTWKLETLEVGGRADLPWVRGRSTLSRPTGGGASIVEYVGLLTRVNGQLRFLVDAYAMFPSATRITPADEPKVRGLDSLWARMYATHDTTAALQLYAPNVVVISANGSHKTRAEELGDVRPYPGMTVEFFRSRPETVKTFENTAVVTGVADWRLVTNGRRRDLQRTYAAVYRRGGPLGWQIVALKMGSAP